MLDQREQQIEGARTQRHRLTLRQHAAFGRPDLETLYVDGRAHARAPLSHGIVLRAYALRNASRLGTLHIV
jgi:hypothetical protein